MIIGSLLMAVPEVKERLLNKMLTISLPALQRQRQKDRTTFMKPQQIVGAGLRP